MEDLPTFVTTDSDYEQKARYTQAIRSGRASPCDTDISPRLNFLITKEKIRSLIIHQRIGGWKKR